MINWIKSLFGQGVVRVEYTTLTGEKGSCKVSYVGAYDEDKLLKSFKDAAHVEHGVPVVDVRVTHCQD